MINYYKYEPFLYDIRSKFLVGFWFWRSRPDMNTERDRLSYTVVRSTLGSRVLRHEGTIENLWTLMVYLFGSNPRVSHFLVYLLFSQRDRHKGLYTLVYRRCVGVNLFWHLSRVVSGLLTVWTQTRFSNRTSEHSIYHQQWWKFGWFQITRTRRLYRLSM